jgi:predicted 2-oxoglutarate/Fe(II)-dependent dioxygenase YbiX
MTKCHNTQSHHPWHQDVPTTGYTSVIYYANDAQGETLFKEGTVNSVKPKKGRMVLFPSDMLHCGSPTTSAKRLVVNYIVKVKQ